METSLSTALPDPCEDVRGTLSLDDAVTRMAAAATPVSEAETLPLREALGRVLAADVTASVDVPAHSNSAMDGYAVAGSSLPGDDAQPRTFEVIGTALAGHPFDRAPAAGECVRIMTGAPMPPGTDTVVMQEHVRRDGDTASIPAGQRAGQHVRLAGEDIRAGTTAVAAGTPLAPAHLGIIASVGVGSVQVLRRPKVAFFSTGDELTAVGAPLAPGQIYDSNRYSLFGMLERLGVEAVDLGVIRDDRDAVEAALREAGKTADAIVTSGGVSVGEADFVTDALRAHGDFDFWKVAMKPGKPIAFGRIGKALFFGLPGNPVSVMVTFYQLVRPTLLALAGRRPEPVLTVSARCETRLKKKPGRREFQRGLLTRAGDEWVVRSAGGQGSGILSSMAAANAFIVLAEDAAGVAPGTMVEVQPFAGFV
jgi:molybdopterin molybdotransferase